MTDTAAIQALLDGDYTAPGVDALLDEAISAELDGALDDVADEWGAGPFALRAAVRGAPDHDERRESLVSARSALAGAAPVPLDDVTRRRLVSGALRETDSTPAAATAGHGRPAARVATLSAAAVAIFLLGIAGALVLSQQSGDSGDDTVAGNADDMAAESAPTETSDALTDLGDLGDVAAVVSDNVGAALVPLDAEEGAVSDGTSAFAQQAPEPESDITSSDADSEARSATATPEECADRVERTLPPDGEAVLRATGTLEGAPQVVVATRSGPIVTVATAPLDRCDLPTLQAFTVAD